MFPETINSIQVKSKVANTNVISKSRNCFAGNETVRSDKGLAKWGEEKIFSLEPGMARRGQHVSLRGQYFKLKV